ncbi:MAG: GNAT family N-acetyltransferase [Candidatus Heimdallarchaeota archaeon]|nr:MAG: GNAT family N-acetyltransferase [Candidatus Heimdallarchaeota archaeon]
MFSVKEIIQNSPYIDYWVLIVEFQINNQQHSFNIHTLDQVFMGDHISLKRAIDQKETLRCFIDIGEEVGGDFLTHGSFSLTWKPEENECYIGTLWIEPEFRGNGLATYIFNEIINFADELGIILTLHAMPFINPRKKPTDEEISKLKDYYRRFGFKENLETKGTGFDCSMERLPN